MRTFAEKPKMTEQVASAKSADSGRAHLGQDRRVSSILYLQRAVGNQATQRLLETGFEEERGAERSFWRAQVLPAISQVLSSPGQSLDESTRASMEPLFGHDFSSVRVHTDSIADASASAINARAYTVGHHILFRDGQYAPLTLQGRRLLAHELTHVVQRDQDGDGSALQPHLEVSADCLPAEREADVASERVMAGQSVQPRAKPAALIHRDGDDQPAFLGYSSQTGVTTPLPVHRALTLEERVAVLERRQAATQLDVRWSHIFNERLASYQQAVYRISNAINTAAGQFQRAQSAQAQTDAMKVQAWGLLISVGSAAVFEPLAAPGLGRLGQMFASINTQIERIGGIDRAVERIENPILALVGGYATNIRGVETAGESRREGQTPAVRPAGTIRAAPVSDPVSFLTSNLETLAGFQRQMEAAFARRAAMLASLSDEQMLEYDPAATEAEYRAALDDMNRAGAGVERLRATGEIARIYEWYMWAAWLRQQVRREGRAGRVNKDLFHPIVELDIGTDVEDRLRNVGVASNAHVTLTGHWYSPNSPDNWMELLVQWADQYEESIATV